MIYDIYLSKPRGYISPSVPTRSNQSRSRETSPYHLKHNGEELVSGAPPAPRGGHTATLASWPNG